MAIRDLFLKLDEHKRSNGVFYRHDYPEYMMTEPGVTPTAILKRLKRIYPERPRKSHIVAVPDVSGAQDTVVELCYAIYTRVFTEEDFIKSSDLWSAICFVLDNANVFGERVVHHMYKSIIESDNNYCLLTIKQRKYMKQRKKEIDFMM